MSIKSENIYDILGIEKDADKKTIKHAYAKLVKKYHPEENPEEWKRIHDAYELAMNIASGPRQQVSVPVMSEPREQEFELTNSVNPPKQKEIPNTPAETTEQREVPSTPVGTTEQKEAPSTPMGASAQNEAPNEPTGMPELALSTPIESHKMQETESENLFGNVEKLANMQREEEEEAAEEKLKSIMYEVWHLSQEDKFTIEEWRKFFDQEDLLPIISQKKFLRELGNDFTLKQIDEEFYEYLNEQLNIISEYIKVHSTDSAGIGNIASVEFAKSKVKAAYRYRLAVEEESRTRVTKWAVFIGAAVIFVLILISLDQDEKRKQQESIEFQEFYQEMRQQEREQTQRWEEWMQNKLDESMESGEWPNYTLEEMLEEGLITQEFYEYMLEYYGVDRDQSETETTEESADVNKE